MRRQRVEFSIRQFPPSSLSLPLCSRSGSDGVIPALLPVNPPDRLFPFGLFSLCYSSSLQTRPFSAPLPAGLGFLSMDAATGVLS